VGGVVHTCTLGKARYKSVHWMSMSLACAARISVDGGSDDGNLVISHDSATVAMHGLLSTMSLITKDGQ